MTFRQFAFNNVLRNKRTYAAYFLSSAFSVMVFFVYAVFAFHPDLANGKVNNNVSTGMHFAEGLIYVFSFFFVLFSMSSFLKTRKKEFGLMVMLGMTNTQLRAMVFLENVLIGLFATLSGIGMGLVFSKLMLLSAGNLLELEETLPFYIPVKALLLTFLAFLILFVVISLFTVSILRGNKLIDLIKGSSMPKPEPKASTLLSLTAALLIGAGYAIALVVKGMAVVAAMIPVTLMVIVGTYFLFTQLSVYLINKSRSNRSFFWRKTNLLFLSDLSYRMKDNARTFFMVSILSTLAFSAIGSLVGFKTMATNLLFEQSPFAMEYVSERGMTKEAATDVRLIESTLTNAAMSYRAYQAFMSEQRLAGSEDTVYVVKASDFNPIAAAAGEKTVEIDNNEAVMIYNENLQIKRTPPSQQGSISLQDLKLNQVGAQPSNTMPLFQDYYIVSDAAYDKLYHKKGRAFYAFDLKSWRATKDISLELEEKLAGDGKSFMSLAYEYALINQSFGIVLFIGLFIGAVFFVASGSFLYFRLYADMPEDKAKFKSITKLGLTDRELSGIVTKQLMILFFVPIVVAFIHGTVALIALQNMFEYSLIQTSMTVLGTFMLIQLIYFLLIRAKYVKQVMV
ncbi:FtsX-like permease family protein [Cohnella boryungensis]|uniref:FtsX-like permease family protein n=1 Tax=Cohnella boryungensis TaxID=768479 RepID=A0ABV8SH35_9BACL